MTQSHVNPDKVPSPGQQSALDALKATEMTRSLESEPQLSAIAVPTAEDLYLKGLSKTRGVEYLAEKLKLARQTPQYGFERCFDLAISLMDPEVGSSAFYEVFRNTTNNSMADSFLSSLPGLNLTNLKEKLDRNWATYLFGGDQGAHTSLEGECLPEWLSGKLRDLRDSLGGDYTVEFVAHRAAGTTAANLSVGLTIEYHDPAPAQQINLQVTESTTESTTIESTLATWEAVEQALRKQGFSSQEISIERELRERVDIKQVIAELESKRDSLLQRGRRHPNKFGNIEVAEVDLAQLKVELPKTSALAAISVTGAAVYVGAFCVSGFNYQAAFVVSVITGAFWVTGSFIAADTYASSKLMRFHPWQRSPHLQELGRALTGHGFVWELTDKLPASDSYPMPLKLRVVVRDTSIKIN